MTTDEEALGLSSHSRATQAKQGQSSRSYNTDEEMVHLEGIRGSPTPSEGDAPRVKERLERLTGATGTAAGEWRLRPPRMPKMPHLQILGGPNPKVKKRPDIDTSKVAL